MKSNTPLTAEEMEERLDEFLIAALSSRRTAAGVACDCQQQLFVLHWVKRIACTHAELAYQFANHAPQAMNLMDDEGIEAWIIHALDVYDKRGMYPAIAIIHQVEGFSQKRKTTGLALEDIERILDIFIAGLGLNRFIPIRKPCFYRLW